jgi:hypothetical protein
VKLVKARSIIMHAVRYLGALTRCNFWIFEPCTKRLARQSGFGSWPGGDARGQRPHVSLYKFIAEHSRKPRDADASPKLSSNFRESG